jgi:hypothetical protein
MQRPPWSQKTASKLSKSVHHQLNMYALAASAAGVGALALVQPAHARIVYTRAHRVISSNTILGLDLNHDGIKDFFLSNYYRIFGSSFQNALNVNPNTGNAVWGTGTYASALPPRVLIGPNSRFGTHRRMAFVRIDCNPGCSFTHTNGQWTNGTCGYLGLKFLINGKIHYGWARLKVNRGPLYQVTLVLLGYAYETIPNKPIITGKTKGPDNTGVKNRDAALNVPKPSEPATLGVLAMGAHGLSVWR